MTRVVVTGVGAITPAGIGAGALWEQTLTGRSLVRQIDRFDASPYRCQIAGQAERKERLTRAIAQPTRSQLTFRRVLHANGFENQFIGFTHD